MGSENFIEKIEKHLHFGDRSKNFVSSMLRTIGSAGRNPQKLAQICTTFDLIMEILNWQDRPLAKFTQILTQYQASIDAKYHNDLKDVFIAEEIERKRAERKGLSITTGK